jgi:hypothetical protein
MEYKGVHCQSVSPPTFSIFPIAPRADDFGPSTQTENQRTRTCRSSLSTRLENSSRLSLPSPVSQYTLFAKEVLPGSPMCILCPFFIICRRLTGCGSPFLQDPPQFIDHFYHFAAELIYGFWRTYSSLSPSSITPHGQVESTSYIGARNLGHGDHKSKMSLPRRLIFTKTGSSKWRDYSGMNSLLVRPSLSIQKTSTSTDVDRLVFYTDVRRLPSDQTRVRRGLPDGQGQQSSAVRLRPSCPRRPSSLNARKGVCQNGADCKVSPLVFDLCFLIDRRTDELSQPPTARLSCFPTPPSGFLPSDGHSSTTSEA